MNKVQDIVQIQPPHGFAEPVADGDAVPSAIAVAASSSQSMSTEDEAKSRKRRKNSGAVVPHSIAAVDTGPMGESSEALATSLTVHPICSKAEILCVYFLSLLPAGRLVLVSILPTAGSLLLNLFTKNLCFRADGTHSS